MKSFLLALRKVLHDRNLAWIRHHRRIAEDFLVNIIERNEGSDLYLYYRRKLIEIINLQTI
jgi:hypothetical protein